MNAPLYTVPALALPDVPPHVAAHLRPVLRAHLDALSPLPAPQELVELLAQMDADAEEASAPRPVNNVVSLADRRKR